MLKCWAATIACYFIHATFALGELSFWIQEIITNEKALSRNWNMWKISTVYSKHKNLVTATNIVSHLRSNAWNTKA